MPVRTGVLKSCLCLLFHLQLISEQIQRGGPHPVQNFFLLRIGGRTWVEKLTPDNAVIFDLTFTDSTTSYAVGENGIILKYKQNTTKAEDNINLPEKFVLHQNFPNPFNPVTKIKFTIPNSPLNPSPYQGEGNRGRLITLKVYDVLGNEIATLVNEVKPAGIYEVDWDASRFSSGVYFYQLNAGSFVETKKMILLR